MLMRRAASPLIRFAAMSSLLIVPACYSLPKVDVIRVVDDFAADAGLQPTWNAFEMWTCGSHVDGGQASDAGLDAGLDGGTDAGQAVTCQLTLGPGDTSEDTELLLGMTDALVARFGVPASLSVEVATQTTSVMSEGATHPTSMPVDLTSFSELRFNAALSDTTGTAPTLPIGTELSVELRCSYSSMNSPSTDYRLKYDKKISGQLSLGVTTFQPIALPLSSFTGASQRQTCLANVNRIVFVVTPGNLQAGNGTLQLDNIRFDNAPPQ
jgi:hypothetical protein